MFTEKQTENLKKQLYEIHRELCLNLIEKDEEIWWPTPFYINPDEYEFRESYDLFNGNCGILLFFLSLYKFDGNKAHLKVINKGMHRILNTDAVRKPKFFALYTGLGGVIYTCLKIFEVTGDVFYKEKALNLTLTNCKQLTENLLKVDILSGYTGNLLMLTLLYHHTGNIEIFNMVTSLIDRLILEARISEQGLKWDYSRSKKAYDSMTGFSHGASGIAWVLMQIGGYFSATGLIYLAEEALKYEMQYFQAPAKNWLDLRLGPHRLNKPNVHEWDLQTFLPEMTDVNAWAHGAAGIGLTRQMAFKLTKKKNYAKDCNIILERCLNDLVKFDRTDFTLVSGYTGMIPFLLNSSKVSGISNETEIVFILDQAAELYRKNQSYNTYVSCGIDDYGLLSGKAGIGYIILNILTDKNAGSILNPELPKQTKNLDFEEKYSEYHIKRAIFSRYYKRTLEALKGENSSLFDVENINDFKIKLQAEISKRNRREAKENFDLEQSIVDLWAQHKGYFSFEQKYKHLLRMADENLFVTDPDLMKRFFKLSDHVKIYRPDKESSHNVLLLISDENGIREMNIGVFAAMILNEIENSKIIGLDLINSIHRIFFKDNATENLLAELRNKVIQQIRLLIKAGFVEVI
jgi:hypothetical protein